MASKFFADALRTTTALSGAMGPHIIRLIWAPWPPFTHSSWMDVETTVITTSSGDLARSVTQKEVPYPWRAKIR